MHAEYSGFVKVIILVKSEAQKQFGQVEDGRLDELINECASLLELNWFTIVTKYGGVVAPTRSNVQTITSLRTTAHPQFLVLELRAPMRTCPER